MGLMKCPECGCDIESSLNQCPLCDCKIHKDGNTQHYTAKNNNTNDLLSGNIFALSWQLYLLFLGLLELIRRI